MVKKNITMGVEILRKILCIQLCQIFFFRDHYDKKIVIETIRTKK